MIATIFVVFNNGIEFIGLKIFINKKNTRGGDILAVLKNSFDLQRRECAA